MAPPRMRGDGRKAKNPGKTLLRLLSYMRQHIPTLIIVLLCIFATAFAQTRGSENVGNLVDEYIVPMVNAGSEDYSPLLKYLIQLACIFGLGMDRKSTR